MIGTNHGGNDTHSCGAMPSARATYAPHRARILGLGLSVGIAIALSGCNGPIENDIECVLNSTGAKFTVKAGTRTEIIGGREAIPVYDRDGFKMFVTSWNIDKWRCRAIASGTSGSAQDRNGLDPKGAGPTAESGDAPKP
jgi:hypothetical protein